MKDQLISYKTAKLAKEKEFDYPTFFFYEENTKLRPNSFKPLYNEDNGTKDYPNGWLDYNYDFSISAPTQSLLQKWLREKHFTDVSVVPLKHKTYFYKVFTHYSNNKALLKQQGKVKDTFCKYEEALEKGLQEALKLI